MILLIAEQIFDNPNNSSQKFPPFLSRLPHPVSFITFLGYHVGIASNNRGELIFMNTNNCETSEAFGTHQQKAVTMGDPTLQCWYSPPPLQVRSQVYNPMGDHPQVWWPSSGVSWYLFPRHNGLEIWYFLVLSLNTLSWSYYDRDYDGSPNLNLFRW